MAFFGESCAVDSLGPLNNPLGDNSNKFCNLCGSATLGIRCTNRDPYAEYSGALRCLQVWKIIIYFILIVFKGKRPHETLVYSAILNYYV